MQDNCIVIIIIISYIYFSIKFAKTLNLVIMSVCLKFSTPKNNEIAKKNYPNDINM